MATPKYNVGSIIEYKTLGGGTTRQVRVETKEPNVKHGEPGFDGVLLESRGTDGGAFGDSVWGYDSQITGVISL